MIFEQIQSVKNIELREREKRNSEREREIGKPKELGKGGFFFFLEALLL